MGGKVCLRCKGKTLLGVVNKLLNVDNTQQWFAFNSQANFPTYNFLNILYFTFRYALYHQSKVLERLLG